MSLADPSAFYAKVASGLLGPKLEPFEQNGCEVILRACEGLPVAPTAYALATAYHETAHTMRPVREIGGPAYFTRMYDIQGNRPEVARALGNLQPGDGALFAGRGFVQLTGRANFARAGEKIGEDLLATPDLALSTSVAARIMRAGMAEGWFTGKRFDSFLPALKAANRDQFTQARRIINGQDRADLVAGYALDFQDALLLGRWA